MEDFETDIKNLLAQPKPEQIIEDLAPGDRDLTTEEVKALERNTTGDFVVK